MTRSTRGIDLIPPPDRAVLFSGRHRQPAKGGWPGKAFHPGIYPYTRRVPRIQVRERCNKNGMDGSPRHPDGPWAAIATFRLTRAPPLGSAAASFSSRSIRAVTRLPEALDVALNDYNNTTVCSGSSPRGCPVGGHDTFYRGPYRDDQPSRED